ncbi:MAG: hypothetical protein KF889_09460 [Alphaproteobacteria bacterium]|nr:hypothetical protein [Alphaproteobacteria bacterium]MCW5741049.1 hypothetical protein [Alphaproteobacteria bacterium]
MITSFPSRVALSLTLAAVALAACGDMGSSGRAPAGGGFYEAADPVADGVSSAFRRPIREGDVQSVLAAHVRSPVYRELAQQTLRKNNCPPSGTCTVRTLLVRVDGTGKPTSEPPSCGLIVSQISGQSLQSMRWERSSGPCGRT